MLWPHSFLTLSFLGYSMLNQSAITTIFERFAEKNPEPKGELHYTTPFELLIAVILSAQATDKSVNRVTTTLFQAAPTPEAMLALGEAGLKTHIQSIGLYNAKAKNIIQACQQLLSHYQGQVPASREALESLAGVGRKTANVVLQMAFGQETIAVDTHVFRVSNRIGLATGKTPLAIETQLLANIPKLYHKHAHHWLILHGRYLCKARKPECATCLIHDLCEKNNV